MFHVKHDLSPLLDWLGIDRETVDWPRLERYEAWLRSEAYVAGGIGPEERDRLTDRHIGDSIAYSRHLGDDPVVDYGSGAGLPGIPLSIVDPGRLVIVRDRSGRRVELMERAVRILELENVTVEQGSVEDDKRQHVQVVTRAVFQLDRWPALMVPRLVIGGRAITSVGGAEIPTSGPAGTSLETATVPSGILDHGVTFLIMSRTE